MIELAPRARGDDEALFDRVVRASVEARVLGAPVHPVRLGRYILESPLGRGGMGRVYLAYDPGLERRAAIKLLWSAAAENPDELARLVRDARVMSRLSHPNVAVVHEVDEVEGRVFVVMEYVDGINVRQWVEERRPKREEIIALFVQAGHGLAAAHAKGVLHRDFKPDNIVVDRDGRARVVDFGLAQAPLSTASLNASRNDDDPASASLTMMGAVGVSAAYLAPEQRDFQTVDERADQYSFCVALFELVVGRRPTEAFAGAEDLSWTRLEVCNRRLVRVLRRGLAVDPEARWSSMDELLDHLVQRPKRGMMIAAVALAAVASGLGTMAWSTSSPCPSTGDAIDAVWNEETRHRIDLEMEGVDAPYMGSVGQATVAGLEAYAGRWKHRAHEQCLAATDASQQWVAASQRCLARGRNEFAHLVDRIDGGDQADWVFAPHDLEALSDPLRCLDADVGEDPWLEPPDSLSELLERARRALAKLDTPEAAVGYEQIAHEGIAAAKAAIEQTEATHADDATARARLLLARLLVRLGDHGTAVRELRAAIDRTDSIGRTYARAQAMIEAVLLIGSDRDRTAEAQAIAEQALATLDSLENPPILRSRLETQLGRARSLSKEADPERAFEHHHRSVRGLIETLGESHPDVAEARLALSSALNESKRPYAAEIELRRALELAHRVWGPEHPHTAKIHGTLGIALMNQSKLEPAKQELLRYVEIQTKAFGANHPEVAAARYQLATLLRQTAAHEQAVEQLQLGLQALEEREGGEDAQRLPWLYAIGDSELARGRPEQALEVLLRAVSVAEATGAGPLELAEIRFALAKASAQRDPVSAKAAASAARDAFERHGDPRYQDAQAFLATLPQP